MEKTLYSTCMYHDMPQSLLVFAVSFTLETLNFWTFFGVAVSLEEFFKVCFLSVYVHIFEIKIMKKINIKKIDYWVQSP